MQTVHEGSQINPPSLTEKEKKLLLLIPKEDAENADNLTECAENKGHRGVPLAVEMLGGHT